jgi:hypothetical protein
MPGGQCATWFAERRCRASAQSCEIDFSPGVDRILFRRCARRTPAWTASPCEVAVSKRLTLADYARAAEAIGCRREVIQAVAEVESLGRCYLPTSGRVVILFEAHVFSRLTAHRFDATHPSISSAKRNRMLYRGGDAEYARLEEALQLEPEAALQSASWGGFQIMGFNAVKAGFANAHHMAFALQEKEQRHLDAFVSFIGSEGLAQTLARSDFDAFALAYNGPRYEENRYPQRMRAALARLMRG